MDCCKNELGNFPHNTDINTGIVITLDGVYSLTFSSINGTSFGLDIDVPSSPPPSTLIIPKGKLNEDLYYCFTILQPSDPNAINPTRELLSVDDCTEFCLKTFILTNPDCGDICAAEGGIIIPT